ncbi:hypothetical protein RRG08_001592 [Elysia crispata]|uniref:Uncharacterized protein n=1 Tax=Elysia crispata TaxID=231223 RepID=A0AAE1AL77_9GAST|nr:hypothetical protein RRG08_001592 [Elysia crispata]
MLTAYSGLRQRNLTSVFQTIFHCVAGAGPLTQYFLTDVLSERHLSLCLENQDPPSTVFLLSESCHKVFPRGLRRVNAAFFLASLTTVLAAGAGRVKRIKSGLNPCLRWKAVKLSPGPVLRVFARRWRLRSVYERRFTPC